MFVRAHETTAITNGCVVHVAGQKHAISQYVWHSMSKTYILFLWGLKVSRLLLCFALIDFIIFSLPTYHFTET